MSFNEQFDQHGLWRRDFSAHLKALAQWLKDNELLDAAVEERLQRLQLQVRSDKVMVAFVAEFSRGKSELINALFFAGYGRRIMPASAGRTTMCPTELGYDADIAPCLRLLPIETRLHPHSLMDWRHAPKKWLQIGLDMDNPAQLAQALQKVAEVRHVTQEEARALGLWSDENPQDNPPLRPDGRVEVPRWRHALINIAHPLLKQGLVILDTPGLNAIGAEPELTVSLLPQAHAVVFILGADTGVTKSDLAIWREHLAGGDQAGHTRLVVLNKIDTLWDALSTPAQVQAQIERQRATSAQMLGVPLAQVLPVSAQKALVAKVTADPALLQASQLPALEAALGQGVMGQRQQVLLAAVAAGVGQVRREAERALQMRRREQSEQMLELRGLKGKNVAVIKHMRSRIEQEQGEFDSSGARIHAVRSVHQSLLAEVVTLLSVPTLKTELAELTAALKQPGVKLRLKATYAQTFSRLRQTLQKGQALAGDISSMLEPAFRQINAEFGFSLQLAPFPDMSRWIEDLDLIERSHLQYLGLGNVLRLAQGEFCERLTRALSNRLRVVFESALGEVELWNKAASAQLDVQLRERRRNFRRRLQAVDRIQQAASGLDERLAEMDAQDARLQALQARLAELSAALVALKPLPFAAQPAAAAPASALAEPA